jgi:hypothetical protein
MSFVDEAYKSVVSSLKRAKHWLVGPSEDKLQKLGEKVKAEVVQNMKDNPPPPLAQRTIARKARQGYSFPARRWYQSGWMVENSIKVEVKKKMFGKTSLLVVGSNEIHPEAGVPAKRLFRWLELGTSTIPPRPVFKPVSKAILRGDFLVDEFSEEMMDYVRSVLKSS